MKKLLVTIFLISLIFLTNYSYAVKPTKKNAQYTGEAIIDYDEMFDAGGFYKVLNKCENDLGKEYRKEIGYLSWQDYVNYNQGVAQYASSIWKVHKCDKDYINNLIKWYDEIIARIENKLNISNTIKNDQIILSKENNNVENDNDLKCAFTFSEYADDKLAYDSSNFRHLSNIKFYVEFFSISKSNWNIKKIYLSENLKQSVFDTFESEKKIWEKIIYNQKLNQNEIKLVNYVLKEADISLSELNKEIKKLSKTEKKEFINVINSNIDKELEKYLPDIDNFIKNQKTYFNEIIQMFDKNKDITVNGNNIKIRFITDAAVIIDINIDYSKILNQNSNNAVLMNLTSPDGSFVNFDSECNNKTTLSSNQIKNEDSIKNSLQTLKSLFDEELITREEYDAKRKEILDEM